MWDQLDAERKEVYKKKTEAAKKVYIQEVFFTETKEAHIMTQAALSYI